MERLDHRSDVCAQVPDSEVILIPVIVAKYFQFQNHHGCDVCFLRETRYLSRRIDVTSLNRHLHKLTDWLAFIATALG